MIRTLEALRREQSEVLSHYREDKARQVPVAVLPRPGVAIPAGVYGRVESIVVSDETYGPHLVVVRQQWSGVPATASDSPAANMRCYPTPNRTVADYEVDDYVRMVTAHGAMVAEKLG